MSDEMTTAYLYGREQTRDEIRMLKAQRDAWRAACVAAWEALEYCNTEDVPADTYKRWFATRAEAEKLSA